MDFRGDKKMTTNNEVVRTERGWDGELWSTSEYQFRRNTLLEYNGKGVVIMTVGLWCDPRVGYHRPLNPDCHYETSAYMAYLSDPNYAYADKSKIVTFNSPCRIKSFVSCYNADLMHEAVVNEITDRLLKGMED
jgi:hypothetical protein